MSNNFKIVDYSKIFNILKSIEQGKELKNEENINLTIKLIKNKYFLDELISQINKSIN